MYLPPQPPTPLRRLVAEVRAQTTTAQALLAQARERAAAAQALNPIAHVDWEAADAQARALGAADSATGLDDSLPFGLLWHSPVS